MDEDKKATVAVLVRKVPLRTRQKFKSSCSMHGYSMNDVLVKVMEYLTDQKSLKLFMANK